MALRPCAVPALTDEAVQDTSLEAGIAGPALIMTRADGLILDIDPVRTDLDRVHQWLSTDALSGPWAGAARP